MPSFEVEFEVFCSCGEGLCNQATGDLSPRGNSVTTEPCTNCLSREYDRGYDDGYEAARKEFEDA